MENSILVELAQILTQKTGLYVGYDHVHESARRFYYIPEADEGKPLFLHHYRGPFFVDVPKADWKKLASREISPAEYVDTAHWYFGYYWGGGAMVSGGYFTPLECTAGIHDPEKIRHFMTILSCRGSFLASGYRPTEKQCEACFVTDCPYSALAEKAFPLYNDALKMVDNRRDLFSAVDRFVDREYGYTLHGMCCGDAIAPDEIKLYPNYGERTFELFISDTLVKELLYDPKIDGYNWDRTVEVMKLYVCKPYTSEKRLIESPEDFEAALRELGIIDKWDEEDRQRAEWAKAKAEPPLDIPPVEETHPKTFWGWLKSLFVK